MRYIVLAYSYVRDYSTAEEIFQECILNLMETREKHSVLNIKAFFASVIKNRCLNYMERERMGGRFGKGAARKEWIDVDIARLSAAGSEETACNIDFPKLIGNCRKRLPELTFDILWQSVWTGCPMMKSVRPLWFPKQKSTLKSKKPSKSSKKNSRTIKCLAYPHLFYSF